MSGRKTRVELPLSQKLQLLQELGAGEKPNSLTEKCKVDRSVISLVKKNQSKVREHAALNKNALYRHHRNLGLIYVQNTSLDTKLVLLFVGNHDQMLRKGIKHVIGKHLAEIS